LPAAKALRSRAGAEDTVGAREDRDARVLVGVEASKRLGERLAGGLVDRVADLGAIDRDDADGAVVVDANGRAHDTSVRGLRTGRR
jgi:hypothetical protein